MADIQANSVGFIGLGAMGMWMATHLAEKLPSNVMIHVYDIVPALMEDIGSKHPGKILGCSSPSEVAERSVR